MSKILTVELDFTLEQLVPALQQTGIEVQHRPGRRLLLPVSAECIPEPVDVLCPAGSADTLEAWGFRIDDQTLELVCGEFDRDILMQGTINPLRKRIAQARVEQALLELEQEDQPLKAGHEQITVGGPKKRQP